MTVGTVNTGSAVNSSRAFCAKIKDNIIVFSERRNACESFYSRDWEFELAVDPSDSKSVYVYRPSC